MKIPVIDFEKLRTTLTPSSDMQEVFKMVAMTVGAVAVFMVFVVVGTFVCLYILFKLFL